MYVVQFDRSIQEHPVYIYDTLISFDFLPRISFPGGERIILFRMIPIKEISRCNSILNCHREFSHRRGKDYRRNRKNVIFRIFLSHSQHVHAIVLDRRAKASSRSLERSRLVAITGEERSVISIRIILGGGGFFLHRGNPPLPPVPAISWSRSINS